MHWQLLYDFNGETTMTYETGFDRLIAPDAFDALKEATHTLIEFCVRQKFNEIVRYQ